MRFNRAADLLEEALEIVQSSNMTWGIANISTLLGHVANEQKDYNLAKVRYSARFAVCHKMGNSTYMAYCLQTIASVVASQNNMLERPS